MMSSKNEQTRRASYQLQPLDALLLAVPLAFLVHFIPGWKNETLLFFICGTALIPLAAWLGRATEHLSARAGPGIGGLLNATLGNAPESILSLAALSKGLIVIVKVSITGAILGNILLVLGTAILAGGTRFSHQRFNQTATRVGATSLSLAAIGLIIPTIFHAATSRQSNEWSSRRDTKPLSGGRRSALCHLHPLACFLVDNTPGPLHDYCCPLLFPAGT